MIQQAVDRLALQKTKKTRDRLNILRKSIAESKNQENKIAVPTNEGLEFIVIKNIVRIESSSSYSSLYLINLNYIRKYIRGEGGQVVMENGDFVDVSRRKKEEFLNFLNE